MSRDQDRNKMKKHTTLALAAIITLAPVAAHAGKVPSIHTACTQPLEGYLNRARWLWYCMDLWLPQAASRMLALTLFVAAVMLSCRKK